MSRPFMPNFSHISVHKASNSTLSVVECDRSLLEERAKITTNNIHFGQSFVIRPKSGGYLYQKDDAFALLNGNQSCGPRRTNFITTQQFTLRFHTFSLKSSNLGEDVLREKQIRSFAEQDTVLTMDLFT